MNFRSFFSILLIGFALLSCKKDEEDNPPLPPQDPVMAGEFDDGFNHREFDPPLQLELELNATTGYHVGSDSIDMDSDGEFDLIFFQMIQLGDSINTDSTTSNDFPQLVLRARHNIEIATREEIVAIGLGQSASIFWADTLHPGERIDTIEDWSDPGSREFMWAVPPSTFPQSNGCWYNLENTTRYVGIREEYGQGYRYGWVEINHISREDVRITACAIEE